MSILLFCVGTIAFLAGVAMAAYGLPVSEFSFGNTLISAGASTAVGGLIVIGLGAVVAKLNHISDSLSSQVPPRSGRPLDLYEPASGSPVAGRIPFPSKPKPAPNPREPQVAAQGPGGPPVEEKAPQSFAPTFAPILPNPDESPTVDDEAALSPQRADLEETPALPPEPPPMPQPPFAPAQSRQHGTYFDSMWPPESREPKTSAAREDDRRESALEPPAPEEEEYVSPAEAPPYPASEMRAVAILKSGVVDGMGYTLYVDGSIEAEMPQGTLRFASINELRSHLEKSAD